MTENTSFPQFELTNIEHQLLHSTSDKKKQILDHMDPAVVEEIAMSSQVVRSALQSSL